MASELDAMIRELTRTVSDHGDRLRHLEALPLQRSWVELEDIAPTADFAFAEFASFATTYRHLRIVGLVRSDRGDITDGIFIRFNADSAANYHWLWEDARNETTTSVPVAGSNDAVADSRAELGFFPAGSAPANVYGPLEISIPHYRSSMYKVGWLIGGHVNAFLRENIFVNRGHFLWAVTDPITTIRIAPLFGTLFKLGSRFTLYGLG